MSVTPIRDEGQTLKAPSGKLLGSVDSPGELEGLASALKDAGFGGVETLSGEEGVRLLERAATFFFSDMEERVLARHTEEVKAGHIVIAIRAPSDRVDEATQVASENGARRLVYFGAMTVTWLTK
jgi:hypothetical protein